jgi:WD40 repeat protein
MVATFGDPGHRGTIHTVAVPEDGSLVASGGDDGVIIIEEVESGRPSLMLEGNPGPIRDLAFDPSGRHLAACDARGRLQLWRLEPGVDASVAPLQAKRLWEVSDAEAHRGAALAIAFRPDGRTILSTGEDGTVRFWSVETGALQQTLEAHAGPIRSLAVATGGDQFATGGDDGAIRIWSPGSRSPVRSWDARQGSIRRVRYSPNGKIIVSSGLGVRLWDTTQGTPVLKLREHAGSVDAVDFSRDGKLLALSDQRGATAVFDLGEIHCRLESMDLGW